jgi:hypothetical protein
MMIAEKKFLSSGDDEVATQSTYGLLKRGTNPILPSVTESARALAGLQLPSSEIPA